MLDNNQNVRKRTNNNNNGDVNNLKLPARYMYCQRMRHVEGIRRLREGD